MVLTIVDENSVKVENNIICVNCGYRSNNLIPVSKITFISEVTNNTSSDDSYLYIAVMLDTVELRIKIPYADETEKQEKSNKIYSVHNKLNEILIEFHKSKHYNFNKPKEFNHE